ncbi:DNA helicase [Deerpox virus W-1170-84]|uniref:DNA helicase n=1 Tax=Deerpox virus (strain W-1170-84) TaxID=305676 RepID=Q08F63_DPV84|nr:DNA helicase [Deerpox virus W-1170-84]AUI80680.1 DNA helicase [White-tailed deer poxvirus]
MSICTVIDYNLYTEMKKIIGDIPLFLFNYKKDFVEVNKMSTFKFYIPMGFFSSFNISLIRQIDSKLINNYLTITDINLPELYPIQKRVINSVLSSMKRKVKEKRPMYITLHLSCGFGKTVLACHLISIHRRKTVICLPNKMLVNQWRSTIENTNMNYLISLDGVRNLLKTLDNKTADILIIVSRHLSNDTFCKRIHDEYDTFILDESHMYNLMNNTSITRFLTFFPPKICYFLTATPRKINRLFCNDVINVSKETEIKKFIKIIEYFFEPYYTETIKQMIKKLNQTDNKYHTYTEKILSEDQPRNNLIIDTVLKEFRNNSINRVIIITKLRKHMILLYNKLLENFDNNIVYLGDAKDKNTSDIIKLIKTKDKFIFVSTVHYSGTGLDIPSLDSLIVCSAVLNSMQIEQLLGRICRESINYNRYVYIFPNTSIKEIKHLIGFFSQKIISLAIDKLGFEKEPKAVKSGRKEESALFKAFNLQNH